MPLIFDDLLQDMANDGEAGNGSCMLGVTIKHPSLDKPIYYKFTDAKEINGQEIVNLIEEVQQSEEDLKVDEEMCITVTKVKPPAGLARDQDLSNWIDHFNRHASGHGGCIIRISNQDQLCCARAIVLGIARLEKNQNDEKKRKYKTMMKARPQGLQTTEAQLLMDLAGLGGHEAGCGYEETQENAGCGAVQHCGFLERRL